MSSKVKRGLGLLVVAVLAFLVLNVTVRASEALSVGNGPVGEVFGWALLIASAAIGVALLASFVGGLVLLAWGLLRD